MMKQKLLYITIGGLFSLLAFAFICLKLYRKPKYLRHFEEAEYGSEKPFLEPQSVNKGLAVYSRGDGEPVLLFPYPHAATTAPMVQGPLAEILVGLGRQVITFDVPGAYRSRRDPVGDMEEMILCAMESLDRLAIEGPVDVVGHSMGGLSALAFSIEKPERTKKLVLIGTFSGFPAATLRGLPGSKWRIIDLDYWRLIVWGIQDKLGTGSLATHKKLQNLMDRASYYDKNFFTPVDIKAEDDEKGVPIREIVWGKNMFRRLTYADKLEMVRAPTLVLTGRHDPEAPLPCSQELQAGIPGARLVAFEQSGHFPFVEEDRLFTHIVKTFFHTTSEG